MKVTSKMIAPQLRLRGNLLRRLLPTGRTEEQLRKQSGRMPALRKLASRKVPHDIRVTEEWIARADGSRLRLVISTPIEPQQNVPGVLYIHGGAYALGIPEQERPLQRQLIAQSDCVVVSPDYRLSPEAPYPAALDDCYAALLWLRDNIERLEVRSDQLAVVGPSAGGGLTAAVTLYARDKGEPSVAFQMPIYPMIDDRCITESARENDAPVYDAATNKAAWKLYLGDLYGAENVPAYAAPARATDYRGLPPTLTYVGDVEPFRDETIEYVKQLRNAGVPVEFELYPGCFHGFDIVAPKADVSVRATQFRNRWFRHAIRTYFAEQPS